MVKRPTIADLASASGVSVATVDRVLNRRMPVSADTARRVVLAAESIGYHAAGLLRRRHDKAPLRRFGFLLQKRADEFYQRLAAQLGAETAAQTNFRGKSTVEFVDDIAPSIVAGRIEQMIHSDLREGFHPLAHFVSCRRQPASPCSPIKGLCASGK